MEKILQQTEEVWRNIPDYEGLYMVSSLGRIKSLSRIVKTKTGTQTVKERILKPYMDRGYCRITLSYGNNFFRKAVHQFVALAFIPNPDNKPHINHINGIRDDNRIENLERCTSSENEIHSYSVLGKVNANRKLTNDDAEYIRTNAVKAERFKKGGNIKLLCEKFKITPNVIHGILKHKHYV